MHELSWITTLWWWSHSWKSLANHLTSDQKIVIHCNKCIILFLTRHFMSWTHNSFKKQSSNAHFVIVTEDGLFWLSIVTTSQLICEYIMNWIGIELKDFQLELNWNWKPELIGIDQFNQFIFNSTPHFARLNFFCMPYYGNSSVTNNLMQI